MFVVCMLFSLDVKMAISAFLSDESLVPVFGDCHQQQFAKRQRTSAVLNKSGGNRAGKLQLTATA